MEETEDIIIIILSIVVGAAAIFLMRSAQMFSFSCFFSFCQIIFLRPV